MLKNSKSEIDSTSEFCFHIDIDLDCDASNVLSIEDRNALERAKESFSYHDGLNMDFDGDVSSLWDTVKIPFVNCMMNMMNGDPIFDRNRVRVVFGDDLWEILYDQGTFLMSKFKKHAEPSTFGHGTETKLDPEIRTCLEIPGDKLRVSGLPRFDNVLDRLMLTSERGVTLHLHKMLLYEAGGHFLEHVDSLHRPGHIASLLVSLPTGSGFRGGSLTVRRGNLKPFVWNASPDSVDAIAFFTDCPHQVTPVTKGKRLILQFDVCVDREFEVMAPVPCVSDLVKNLSIECKDIPSNTSEAILPQQLENTDIAEVELLKHYQDDRSRIHEIIAKWKQQLAENNRMQYGHLLKHKYAKTDIVPSMLKGADATLYQELCKEPAIKVRLCSLVLHTIRNIREYDYDDVDLRAFVWKSENTNIDRTRAQLSVSMYASGIQWYFMEGRAYIGNKALPEQSRYLSAALFVELANGQKE